MYVYVIAKSVSPQNVMKIGISRDPMARLKQLQTGSEALLQFAMVAWFDGEAQARNVERLMHQELKQWRYEGEWFHSDIGRFIRKAKKHPWDRPGCTQFQMRRLKGTHKEIVSELRVDIVDENSPSLRT